MYKGHEMVQAQSFLKFPHKKTQIPCYHYSLEFKFNKEPADIAFKATLKSTVVLALPNTRKPNREEESTKHSFFPARSVLLDWPSK